MEKKDRSRENELARKRYKINGDIKRERVRRYKEENKDIIKVKNAEYRKKRKSSDPLYKFIESIRNGILNSFKKHGYTKNSKTYEILGCSVEEFKLHIESQFEDWMTWDNRGLATDYKTKWVIDHIIPLDTAKTVDDIIRLNHYTNLRPLCSKVS